MNLIFFGSLTVLAPIYLLILKSELTGLDGYMQDSGYMFGRDFVNFWLGGLTAVKGDTGLLFSFDRYYGMAREVLGAALNEHNWSYPPHMLLFLLPIGLLSYGVALLAWSVCGLITYLASTLKASLRAEDLILLALAPASLFALVCGQNGFFTAALFIAGFRLLGPHPVLAGVCFGLLTIKPQLGVLIPFALLASRQWVPIISAAATGIGLALASGFVFGFETWALYISETMPFQSDVMTKGTGLFLYMVPTVFMSLRLLGFESANAFLVHAPFALIGIACVVWAFSKKRDTNLQFAVLAAATLLTTPYGFYYDMTIASFAALLLARHLEAAGKPLHLLLVPWLFWALPALGMSAALWDLPIAPLFVLLFLVVAIQELKALPAANLT